MPNYFLIFITVNSKLHNSNKLTEKQPEIPKLKKSTIIILSILLLQLACTTEQKQATTQSNKTLQVILASSPENLDPQSLIFTADWQAAALVYEGLVQFTENDRTLQPLLAESWQVLDGGKRLVFKLREDVFFHDDPCFPNGKGRKLTPKDVVYTFEQLARAKDCSKWYLFAGKIMGIDDFREGTAKKIEGITILDDHRIQFELTRPYVAFLKILATPTAFIIPREAVEYYGENFKEHPVGTGPFRLVRWKPFEEMVYVRNENYWRFAQNRQRLPVLDGVKFRLISNYSLGLAEFLKGDNHFLTITHQDYLRLQADPSFSQNFQVAGVSQGLTVRFFGFAMDKPTTLAQNTQLRQALAMSFNRQRIVSEVLHDVYKIAHTLVPPHLLGISKSNLPEFHPFNPEQGRKIVNQLNTEVKADSFEFWANIETRGGDSFIKESREIGVPITFHHVPAGYYPSIINERPDVFRVSYHPSFLDPEEYYVLFYSKSDPSINLCGYKNPEFDAVLEQTMVEQAPQKRQALFLQLEAILRKDVPAIYLHHNPDRYFIAPKNVTGLKLRSGIMDFSEVTLQTVKY